jgi:toxin CptA
MLPALRLKLRPSWRLAALLLLLNAAALAAVWVLMFPLWIRLAIAGALIAALIQALRRSALLLSPNAIVELGCTDDGRLDLIQRDGECLEAEVLPDTAVYRAAVLLRVRVGGRRSARSIVVFPDSAAPQELRRLRVWLRWKRPVSRAETSA